MPADLLGQLQGLFTDRTRLYRLQGEGALSQLLVESWRQDESLDAPWRLQLDALSTDAALDVHAMLGQPVQLLTRLSGGDEHARCGLVTAASSTDSDGGLARYRLLIEPWLGLLAHQTSSRVWQDKPLTDIIDSVLVGTPQAAWTYADCIAPHLEASANAGERSYTVQYRESDLAFLHRLLAREAISYRIEAHEDSPAGHRVVFFADSVSKTSCPEDTSSASALDGPGIRYHRANSQEEQDAIQAFGGARRLTATRVATLAWDYKAKHAIAVEVPSAAANAGPNAPSLEHYRHQRAYAAADTAQAQRTATHIAQALEARHKTFFGRSTVRSFGAGAHFTLADSDMQLLDEIEQDDDSNNTSTPDRHRYLITRVQHLGINNLPKALSEHIAKTLGAPEPIEQDASLAPLAPEVHAQAEQSGYANAFECLRAAVPWRPAATAMPAAPIYPGWLTATVVGPQGETSASGAQQIHMDRLGRVRIAFDFQRHAQHAQTSNSSTWVRVLQRWAGAGMGMQFMPRIGQQVLVDFLDGNIERPLVLGSLYDGRGEGAVPTTPGGKTAEQDRSAFKDSSDHRPGAQANQTAGHSPAWHGASADDIQAGGQANAAALSGYKSAEIDNEGSGYNQLVFDDTNGQLRTQLATTQHATQLNLGHLIHQADNHRGSFKGLGFELRTDAYGAIRAGRGVLVSSYGTAQSEPAGDNAAGMALQGQLVQLSQTLSNAAQTHQTSPLAAHIGSFKATQASLSDKEPPAKAMHTAIKGMVDNKGFDPAQSNAAEKSNRTGQDKLPHSTDPVVLIEAKAGQAAIAGQDLQMAAQELIHIASGQDTYVASGAAMRIHTGQAIGMLAGAVKAGDEEQGKGLTLIAGSGDIDVQSQSDAMQIAAQQQLSIQSKTEHIDWAAAKRIVLQTAGGASVTIEGGNITVECPGKITIEASKRSFMGAENEPTRLPELPRHTMINDERFQLVDGSGDPLKNFRVEIIKPDGSATQVVSDANGMLPLQQGFSPDQLKLRVLSRVGQS
jgi:type VI secretion system secreted protein VgrG